MMDPAKTIKSRRGLLLSFLRKTKNHTETSKQTLRFSISYMAFFTSAIGTLKVLVIALGAGLGVWGVINLLEGYGNDNPGAKSQGMKQVMAN